MYTHCIFCKNQLGNNEVIERFPVGRRLAFDAAQGRLWVVCKSCNRWNLTPIEERWEAIEECERLYRDTRTRLATEHIGLARVSEGTDLVRIGEPQRPEFAAWRYGPSLRKRRTKQHVLIGASFALGIGYLVFFKPVFAVLGGATSLTMQIPGYLAQYYQSRRTLVRLRADSGEELKVNRKQAWKTSIEPEGDSWFLRLNHTDGWTRFWGADALSASALVLPHINHSGASSREVEDAVHVVEKTPDADECFAFAAKHLSKRAAFQGSLVNAPLPMRLALEMVSHEQQERRALEGELHELEAMWREAEEIAAISDNLLLPRSIMERFRRVGSE